MDFFGSGWCRQGADAHAHTEAARLIKSKNPHSMVEVKDLQSGDVTAVALRPG
jgi:hypothetical protein